jgi:chromate transporter
VTYRSKVNPLVPMAVGTAGYLLVWLAGLS